MRHDHQTAFSVVTLASAAANIGTMGSLVVAITAAVIAIRANGHARRSTAAAELAATAAQQAATAAERTADAEQTVAKIEAARHERELAAEDHAQGIAEHTARAAELDVHTEIAREVASFGDDGISYFLVVSNRGRHKATNIAISNLACNGKGDHDFPPTAAPEHLHPREAILAQRDLHIPLISCGVRNCWDVSECAIAWEDGNGAHNLRFQVTKRW